MEFLISTFSEQLNAILVSDTTINSINFNVDGKVCDNRKGLEKAEYKGLALPACNHSLCVVWMLDAASLCGLNTMLCFINAIIHTSSRMFSLFSLLLLDL